MNSDIAISVKNVSKTFKIPHEKVSSLRGAAVSVFKRNRGYEEFKALDDVSFEVKKGEFFGIIGRNGSGKSTLLKILAGIYQADAPRKFTPVKSSKARRLEGEFHGVKINGRISPFLELGIGFNPELSGRDNVYLNATVLGLTKKEIDEKFDSIVAFSELERFIDQKLKNYSSGMQVRLAFSVSIHANREILLMDEVLAVGDSNFQAKCLEEFNRYKDMGKTVILVTHDIGTVQRYCDRAMLIRNGKIVKIGSSEEVGNDYLFQNMSDEEKRMQQKESLDIDQEEDVDSQKTNIKQIAEITKVVFLDEEGIGKNVFKTGENMSIRVYFKINKNKPKFNFGLSLFSINREYLFGTNTIFDKINVEQILKNGYYQVNFKKIPFTTNTYYIHTSIVGENFNSYYAFVEKSIFFKVYFNKKTEGLFDLEYSWDV